MMPGTIAMAVTGLLGLLLAQGRYSVRITAAGGETDALVAKDRAYIERVVDALNEAIVRRG